MLEQDDYGPIAGCVFARARNPFSRRLIALPFSDYCAPLEVETGGCAALLEALAARLSVAGEACELRGATAPSPWVVDDRFRHWKLDLGVGVKAVEQAMDRNFRRQIRRAREAGLTVSYGASTDYARRFYRLHLENRRRLGLPAPPWRFFRLVAEILGAAGRFEVWLADADGRELGGVVLLKDRATLHCKWSARAYRRRARRQPRRHGHAEEAGMTVQIALPHLLAASAPPSEPTLLDFYPLIWWMVLLKVAAVFIFLLLTTMFMIWAERRVIGRMQNRPGPNRAGPFGLLQPIADALKLPLKEDIIPTTADRLIFIAAPILSAAVAFIGFSIIPVGPEVSIFHHYTPLLCYGRPRRVLAMRLCHFKGRSG